MKISTLIAVIALSIVINCCNAQADEVVAQTNYSRNILGRVGYVQDPRTGVCFAVYTLMNTVSMATVPCEKIPKQLLNKGE
jgi:hypothetical protein